MGDSVPDGGKGKESGKKMRSEVRQGVAVEKDGGRGGVEWSGEERKIQEERQW